MVDEITTNSRVLETAARQVRRAQRHNVALTVGNELQKARQDLGWTATELVQRYIQPAGPTRYSTEFTESTRYNVEFGFAPCRLPVLVNLCWLMAIDPPDLLALVMQQLSLDLHLINLHVDLYAVAGDDEYPRLRVVRRWAQECLDRDHHRHGVVQIAPATVARLAAALPISVDALQCYFARNRPGSVHSSTGHPGRLDPAEPFPSAVTHERLAAVLGAERRHVRTTLAWSPAGLAHRLPRASAASVRNHEAGKALVDVAQLIELGHTLGTPAPRLLGGALRRLPNPTGERRPLPRPSR